MSRIDGVINHYLENEMGNQGMGYDVLVKGDTGRYDLAALITGDEDRYLPHVTFIDVNEYRSERKEKQLFRDARSGLGWEVQFQRESLGDHPLYVNSIYVTDSANPDLIDDFAELFLEKSDWRDYEEFEI